MIKITIITVVFNDPIGLENTILSVLSQSFSNKEYIIIDGGSSDGTIDVIKKYENRIDKWVSEPDGGIFDAMNKGIRMATGEWLNMMNAGDVFFSSSTLSDVFANDIPDSAQFIYSDCELRYPNGRKIIKRTSEKDGDIYHQASIYKKELHDMYGYYCTKKPMVISDYLFFCLIPSESYFHINQVIASFDMSGVSNRGLWCRVQITCFKYIFNKISFYAFCRRVFKHFLKSVLPGFVGRSWDFVKLNLTSK